MGHRVGEAETDNVESGNPPPVDTSPGTSPKVGGVIVETSAGKVEGFSDEHDRVLRFRRLPYAAAERFQAPGPPTPWSGVRDATRFGPLAPQSISPTDRFLGLELDHTDEDCLALNVWTPAADGARRPVLVWIHGGGFTAGAGHLPHYDAANLVRAGEGDLVVVTINYRLGALGFLHLDEMLPDFAGSGRNGLRDQIAALRWVRDNIASFGGDPYQVTVFGQSAGAMSIAALMASPEAKGLFHGAIAQSGAAETLLRPDQAAWVTERLVELLELEGATGRERAAHLLDVPADRFVAAQGILEAELVTRRPEPGLPGPRHLQLYLQPVIDGELVPASPLSAIRAGAAGGVPLVTGTTRDEWRLFMVNDLVGEMSEEKLRRRAARVVGPEHVDAALATYRDARPEADQVDVLCALIGDYVFRMPAVRLAEAQAEHAPVAMYRFDYPSAAFGGLPGACHAIEVPFVFGNVALPGLDALLGGVDDGTLRLSQQCAQAWAAMARTGSPTSPDLLWPDYDEDRRTTLVLDRDVSLVDDPEGRVRAFWAELGV